MGDTDFFGNYIPSFSAAEFQLAVDFCHIMLANGYKIDLDTQTECEDDIMSNITGHYYIHETTDMDKVLSYLYDVFYYNATKNPLVYIRPWVDWTKGVIKKYFYGDLNSYNLYCELTGQQTGCHRSFINNIINGSNVFYPTLGKYNEEIVSDTRKARKNTGLNYNAKDVFKGIVEINYEMGIKPYFVFP